MDADFILNIHMQLDQVWDVFLHGVPPEVTHHQLNLHPGANWWLKTAVLKQEHHMSALHMWKQVQQTHADLVHITPHCFDWNQKLMPWACSIWIRKHKDVHVEFTDPHWMYHVVSEDISNQIWCDTFNRWLKGHHNKHLKKTQHNTWHMWQESIQLLEHWCSEHQAHARRRQIKVLQHEEGSSSTHN